MILLQYKHVNTTVFVLKSFIQTGKGNLVADRFSSLFFSNRFFICSYLSWYFRLESVKRLADAYEGGFSGLENISNQTVLSSIIGEALTRPWNISRELSGEILLFIFLWWSDLPYVSHAILLKYLNEIKLGTEMDPSRNGRPNKGQHRNWAWLAGNGWISLVFASIFYFIFLRWLLDSQADSLQADVLKKA